ncbi:MAG: hypothetical protein GF364_17750 [Candidatus Lokiarchaeota archaeon]|nr:hypothetical protein [Candidatus Lokiarchaeota archaeon]
MPPSHAEHLTSRGTNRRVRPTLRRWDRNGTFQAYRTAGNHRLNTFSPFPEHNLRR